MSKENNAPVTYTEQTRTGEESRPEMNEEQKKAAYYTENAVVAAGAGSGKTMVLANRFAWLITEKGCKIDEILTLTFTKKAASQMFSRIHTLLTLIANNDSGIKGIRAGQAIDDFVHARIQTLDSYSTSLVRQCAPRYGINPDCEIDMERSRGIATEEALPFLISHRRHPVIERLYSDNRPNQIVHNIFSDFLNNFCRIDKERDFTEDVKKQFNIICEEWRTQTNEISSILEELEKNKNNIHTMCPDLVPIMKKHEGKTINLVPVCDIRKYFDFLLNESVESVIEKAESHSIQSSLTRILYYISDLSGATIKRGTPRFNSVKDSIKQTRALFNKFSSIVVYCMQAGLILSFMSLLNKLQKQFLNRKRVEGVLKFGDIASLSRTILLEQKDIRQSEKESFKAIMIDEFQDNNELQKDLLFLLAEKIDLSGGGVPSPEDLCPGKLFFVGDEKQSVYLFRDADVSVFRKLKDEIKSENLPLKINYRSVSGLIGAFNAIFGGSEYDPNGEKALHEYPSVFAPQTSSLPLYEAAFSPLKAKNEGKGSLSICILNGKEEEDISEGDSHLTPAESEAHFTAEKIEQLLREKTETGEQKYQPKDIAILFRTYNSQHLFEKHLRFSGIPYTCENINDLFFSGVVNDIMSALRLAAHSFDSASYAEMLRSPFAGLSLSGTVICLSLFKANNTNESLNEKSMPFDDAPLSLLDDEDREKYLCGKKIYDCLCEKAASENVSSLVSWLWYSEGYRYETEWHPNTSVYREYFDYLYHLAVKADNANQGLAVFTEQIRELRDSKERLKDLVLPLDRPGAVHLLTIHKSKGLEFPVVFVCCCGKRAKGNQSKIINDSNNAGIVFGPPVPAQLYNIPDVKKNFFWEQVKTEESRKDTAELRRLLYVAMTRAEEKLFLTGILNITDDTENDDFSIKIKNYTDEKIAQKDKNNEIYIEGDSIINNDTFFGILLPSISSRIPPEGLKKEMSFFNIEAIPSYTKQYIENREIKNISYKNNQEGLNEYLKKTARCYSGARIITTPKLYDNHLTPVSLRREEDNDGAETSYSAYDRGNVIDMEFSGDNSCDVFNKVDDMLSLFSQNDDKNNTRFNSGSFGTIAHICVDAALSKRSDILVPSNISCLLKPAELTAFLEAGKELAERFLISPLGKIAETSCLRESEFSFRSIILNKEGKAVFINGVIDLIFDDNDCIHVVDFKTDNKEIPSEHVAQMTCYYHAVSDIFAIPFNKQCRIWLYYLRTGHAIEMTENAKLFKIEGRVFSS